MTLNLEAIRDLWKATTAGQWLEAPGQFIVTDVLGGSDLETGIIVAEVPCGAGNPADVAFIAQVHALIPELLAEVERLRGLAASAPRQEVVSEWWNDARQAMQVIVSSAAFLPAEQAALVERNIKRLDDVLRMVNRATRKGAVREFCPFCDAPIQRRPPDYLDVCPEHGVLDGITDAEWTALERERGVSDGTD